MLIKVNEPPARRGEEPGDERRVTAGGAAKDDRPAEGTT
jgi:hypothetical protein